jgi:hypothetical protein
LCGRLRKSSEDTPPSRQPWTPARDDYARIEELAVLLDEASAEDPEFGSQIRAQWNHSSLMASDGGVVNLFHGEAGKVIHLRDVDGDLDIS